MTGGHSTNDDGAPVQQPYVRPPIIEAVIEIRFEEHLDKKLVDKLRNKFKVEYPNIEPVAHVAAFVDVQQRQTQYREDNAGYRLASDDRADVLMVTTASMSVSRVAPYQGWDPFRTRAKTNWETWRRVAKHHKIQRLGLRYINRIDIPVGQNDRLNVEEYTNVYVNLPEPSGYTMHVSQFSVLQSSGWLGQDDCQLLINSSVGQSPLIGHVAITLDLDISRTNDVPQNGDEIWALLEAMRAHKNKIFEASITEKSRELFRS